MIYKLKLITVFFLLLFSDSLFAGKWIIGGSLPLATHHNEDKSINLQLQDAGINATANTKNTARTVRQLYGGYDFSKRWGVELGYLDLGEVETTFTGTTVDIEMFLNSVEDIHPQTAQGWLLSMIHYISVDHETRIKLRLGFYDWSADYVLQAGNASKQVQQNETEISYGIGLETGRCRRQGIYGHIKWEQHVINKKDFGVLGIGLSFCF
jgi:OmpA-like transmembrane domain